MNSKQKRQAFGDEAVKELDILNFIDEYNCYMCGVNVAD